MGVLDQIVAHKREELAGRRRQTPLAEMRRRAADAPPARPFHAALIASWPALVSRLPAHLWPAPPALAPAGTAGVRLIAEVKGSSPSAGTIRAEFDPVAIARTYAAAGASAVSVLTDARFFAGADEHLARVRAAVDVPILRKDFILDPYQVHEARAIGADAVLLIAAILDRAALADLVSLAEELGMAALVEAHTEPEVATALAVRAALVGINNRNLDTLETSLEVTRRLRPLVPPEVTVVAESGIEDRRDVEEMGRLGVHAVLVGTALMRSADPGARVRDLLGVPA
ncbi:MAG TPA: indole-3-glycerol phosphate synthase TrpC [bacterium]|nr:indole-3-glycerol phosphate synthase TrpC [bacterium]